MAVVVVRLDESGMQRLNVEVATMRAAVNAQVGHDARRGVPMRTGDLRRSIRERSHPPHSHRVYVGGKGLEYWRDQEYGAGPHVIRPRRKKALWWPGLPHPVAKVNHPGNPEIAYMRRAIYKRRHIRRAGTPGRWAVT